VFENVPSILHPRNKHVFEELRSSARRAGYETTAVVAKATDYGVAQGRQRVFLLGSRDGAPIAPEITHGEGLLPFVGAGEVLAPFEGNEFFEPEEVISGRWAEHLREVKPGMNYKWHTAWAGHPNPTFETETRYWNFLLKLDPALPSWTLPASPGPWTGPFHWANRRLRTPEMAALQAFPIGYSFAGPRRERVRQIGNAVPVTMGAAMIGSVLAAVYSKRMAA
jgi:DNA (cytosine-5)-methyltransferase 1